MTGKLLNAVEKNCPIILMAAWMIVQFCIFYFTGIQSSGESLKYIGQAYNIVHDHRIDGARYVFYIIPILIIALFQLSHLPLISYIFFQLLLNGISTIAFYKTAKYLFKKNFFASIATFLFITFIPYQSWNFFYYTDSLFYSLSVLFFYALIVLNDEEVTTFFLRIIILILLVFSRPLGILFIVPFGIFYFTKWKIKFWQKIFCAIILFFLSISAINFLYNGGGDMNILFPQTQGYIICFQNSAISQSVAYINVSGNPVKDILNYILQNPVRFFQLAGLRAVSFFNLCRPYYSPLHNAYLFFNMLMLYVSAIISLIKFSLFKTPEVKNFILTIFILFTAGVMLQCDDYNSRFVMPVFPIIILVAVDFWNKIFSKKLNGKL